MLLVEGTGMSDAPGAEYVLVSVEENKNPWRVQLKVPIPALHAFTGNNDAKARLDLSMALDSSQRRIRGRSEATKPYCLAEYESSHLMGHT